MITSDRGFAGVYNVNVLRRTEELIALLRQEGKEPVLYVVGRKGVTYYCFRHRDMAETCTGFSEQPRYSDAQEVGERRSSTPSPPVRTTRRAAPAPTASSASTSSTSSTPSSARCSPRCPVAKRMAPLEVEEVEEFDYEREDREHGAGRERLRRPDVVRVRAVGRGPARRAAAEVRHHPDLRGAARGGGLGVGVAPPGDEVGHGQRRGADQEPHPAGEPGPPGRDHPGDQRDRRRRPTRWSRPAPGD